MEVWKLCRIEPACLRSPGTKTGHQCDSLIFSRGAAYRYSRIHEDGALADWPRLWSRRHFRGIGRLPQNIYPVSTVGLQPFLDATGMSQLGEAGSRAWGPPVWGYRRARFLQCDFHPVWVVSRGLHDGGRVSSLD